VRLWRFIMRYSILSKTLLKVWMTQPKLMQHLPFCTFTGVIYLIITITVSNPVFLWPATPNRHHRIWKCFLSWTLPSHKCCNMFVPYTLFYRTEITGSCILALIHNFQYVSTYYHHIHVAKNFIKDYNGTLDDNGTRQGRCSGQTLLV